MADEKRLPMQSTVFFLAILGLMFFLTWQVFKPFMIFMVVGVMVAVLALPIDRFWERFLPNRLAAFGTMFTIVLIISVPLVGLGFALFSDAETIIERIESGEVENDLNAVLDIVYPDQTPEERNETVDNLWRDFQPTLEQQLRSLAGKAAGFLSSFFVAMTVILFVTYYVLTDGNQLINYIRRAAPLPATQVDLIMAQGHNGLKAVFYGQILTSVIQGGLGGVGFLITGVPGAVVWAAVMAILSLLPVIGAFLVWVPAAIWLLVQGETWQGIVLIAWGAIIVSQVDNFIRPKLIGNRADIHPLFVLVGVLGGIAAFGFIGLFLGPLLVGITVSILKVWESDYLDPSLYGHVHDSDEEHVHHHPPPIPRKKNAD